MSDIEAGLYAGEPKNRTPATEATLRQVVAALGGGVPGGGTGDASAANQTLQLAQETATAAAVGAKADPIATDTASSWSIVALLKGILSRLLGTISVGGTVAAGSAPTQPPLSVSGIDGGGLKRHFLTDTTGRQVIVTSPPIEVRTTIGALAASAAAYSDVMDLGPAETRQHTLIMMYKSGVASPGEFINLQWSDNNANWRANLPSPIGNSSGQFSYNSISNATMITQGRPMGRYVRGVLANGSTPQTALYFSLIAFAGV